MTSNAWQDLGHAITEARLALGMSRQDLAGKALDNEARRGYVGQVERGLRKLSPETIDKFDQVLDLPDDIVRAARVAPPPPKPEAKGKTPAQDKPIEAVDHDVERLIARVSKDENAPPAAEALLIALAYEFAEGPHRDLQDAYTMLRKALEAAERIRQRGEMPPDNTGSQLNLVMAEVAALNADDRRDEADELLEAEERRMRQAHREERERMAQAAQALLQRRLDQDRLRNRPDLAAKRLIADLRRQAPPGGMFWATVKLSGGWRKRGDKTGDMFALRLSLELAKANYQRYQKKTGLQAAALYSLGWAYLRLAQRAPNTRYLELARNAFEGAVKKTSKAKVPLNWASREDGLGSVLAEIGERAADAAMLEQAVTAHRSALKIVLAHDGEAAQGYWGNLGNTLQKLGELRRDPALLAEAIEALETSQSLTDKGADRLDWEMSRNNLGVALRWLGEVRAELDLLDQARAAYDDCEALDTQEQAPFKWARLQWNIADLALARFGLEPDPALLDEAEHHVRAAREVFVDGSDYQTERCDELLRKIEEARLD